MGTPEGRFDIIRFILSRLLLYLTQISHKQLIDHSEDKGSKLLQNIGQ
jgi:hypothetical protein